MKNQGVWITRIIMLAIFVFVVAYMGYHVVSALSDPVRTHTAILYKTEETAAFRGLVIRDEAALALPSGFLEFKVAEGEKVAKNQVIATIYTDPSTMRINEELLSLEARLGQFLYMESRSESSTSIAELDRNIQRSLTGIMGCASDGHILELKDHALEFKYSLFRREYAYGGLTGLSETIDELTLEIESLKQRSLIAESQFAVASAGLFSPYADGLEGRLSPNSMERL